MLHCTCEFLNCSIKPATSVSYISPTPTRSEPAHFGLLVPPQSWARKRNEMHQHPVSADKAHRNSHGACRWMPASSAKPNHLAASKAGWVPNCLSPSSQGSSYSSGSQLAVAPIVYNIVIYCNIIQSYNHIWRLRHFRWTRPFAPSGPNKIKSQSSTGVGSLLDVVWRAHPHQNSIYLLGRDVSCDL